jgi:tRNA threonylcarbamoyladenosine modification (KEOPS) complex  Pcc1 subunit
VILPRKGDLNVDKTVNQTDYVNLYERFTNDFLKKIIRGSELWQSVYTYRVADVNEDRNANTIDANVLAAQTQLTEYYVTLPTSKTDTTVPTPSDATPKPEVAVPSEKAALKLEYLGIGDEPQPMETATDITADDVGKVVWVGVSVEHAERLGEYFTNEGISTMDIAFDYDPTIFEPCGYQGATGKTAWLDEIQFRNFDSDAQSDDKLYWNSQSVEIDSDAATMDYAPPDGDSWRESPNDLDYETAYIPLRASGSGTEYRLKGVTTNIGTVYLMRVPFLIKAEPTAKKAIQLHLGPQTFIFGTSEDGAQTYGAWERTDKTTAAVNLKNYFTWDENYEPSDAYLTNIQAFTYTPPAKDGTTVEPTEIPLYRDKDLTESGYDAKTYDYYATVSNDVEQITLHLTPDKSVTVSLSYMTTFTPLETTAPTEVVTTGGVDADDDSVTYRDTDPMTLEEVTPDVLEDTDGDGTGDAYGFSNIIEIALPDGVTVYTVHVRRYQKPRIELAYGNSPAGLIMRDTYHGWTDEDKQTAIEKFTGKSTNKNKRYDSEYVPVVSVKAGKPTYAQTDMPYTTNAWIRSYKNVNYDLNEYSFFVYQNARAKEPGCSLINEYGLEVNTTITAKVTVKYTATKYTGLPSYNKDDSVAHVSDYTISKSSAGLYVLGSRMIRPDVYTMNYSCEYEDIDGNILALTNSRPFIVLNKLGDVSMNPTSSLNATDATVLKKNYSSISTGNSLFAYRIADVNLYTIKNNTQTTLNATDAQALRTSYNKSWFTAMKFYPDLQ